MNPKSILIISFSHIGDVVLSTAVIPPLQRYFPDAKISILVGPKACDILWGDVRLNKIIVFDNKGQHKGFKGLLKLVNELTNMKFDLVVNLRDAFWANFIGGKSWNMPLLQRLSPNYRELHAVDRYLNVLNRNGGIKSNDGIPKILLQDYEKQQAFDFLSQNNVNLGDTIIGIHPGGSWKYKLWPIKRFVNLGDYLSQEFNAKVLIFAGPDEADLQTQMAELMRSRPILVRNLGLRQLAALIQRCHLYIGNDTGPMHIAAAMGTQVVSMFGSTNASRSGPYGNGHIVISTKLGCAPCHPGKHPAGCKRGSCLAMESIPFDQVANIVGKIINEKKEWYITC
jgi:ADP-heptose:LPS heptosyltransferase